jgi:hypothetical protein
MTAMMRTGLVLMVATVATVAACSARRAQVADCPGTVSATVRNFWNYPVDVYADKRTGGFILGEVRPGSREEFTLPDDATGVYFRWRGVTAPGPTSSDVSVSYACR